MRIFVEIRVLKYQFQIEMMDSVFFIRRVPPYHHILGANFDDFQKKASMLPKVFIYQIIHGSG